jgi:hypothetical protein
MTSAQEAALVKFLETGAMAALAAGIERVVTAELVDSACAGESRAMRVASYRLYAVRELLAAADAYYRAPRLSMALP